MWLLSLPSLCRHQGKTVKNRHPDHRQEVPEAGGVPDQALAERLNRLARLYPPAQFPGRAAVHHEQQSETPGRLSPGQLRHIAPAKPEFIRRVPLSRDWTHPPSEAQAAGFRENATSQPTTGVQQPRPAAVSIEKQAITPIHPRAEAFITIIVTIILLTGFSTGSHGRIVAVQSVMIGALLSHSAISGRITTVNSSLSALAAIGPATATGATTGMDGIPTPGTGIILRNIRSPAIRTITTTTILHPRARR